MIEQYATLLESVRRQKPLIHHITNYVTVNDCANITLAIGASPIMADALEEAADIAKISTALVLNMGTLNERTVLSMIAAGKTANESGIPIVLDPVGAGASKFRNDTAAQLLDEIKISVLRGNISEIRFLAGLQSETKGVDASDDDIKNIEDAITVARALASRQGCVTVITGAVDVVTDGNKVICIENGTPMLSNITGTGCMCTSLIGSFCGANQDMLLEASAAALFSMGIAGEIAQELAESEGNGSFRIALHNAISRMDDNMFRGRARFYEA